MSLSPISPTPDESACSEQWMDEVAAACDEALVGGSLGEVLDELPESMRLRLHKGLACAQLLRRHLPALPSTVTSETPTSPWVTPCPNPAIPSCYSRVPTDWNTNTGEKQLKLGEAGRPITGTTLSDDGSRIYAFTNEHVRVWGGSAKTAAAR